MPKVICTRPNASDEISGVKFVSHGAGGMISEDISDEQAARFASIPGYAIAGMRQEDPDAVAKEADEMAALLKKAEELGVKVDSRWKAPRLASEIEKADKADKAAKDAAGQGSANQ